MFGRGKENCPNPDHGYSRFRGLRAFFRCSRQSVSHFHLDILPEGRLLSPRMSTEEQNERIELLQGTLDLLILRTLLLGPTHGHAIAKAIEFRSEDVLQ